MCVYIQVEIRRKTTLGAGIQEIFTIFFKIKKVSFYSLEPISSCLVLGLKAYIITTPSFLFLFFLKSMFIRNQIQVIMFTQIYFTDITITPAPKMNVLLKERLNNR